MTKDKDDVDVDVEWGEAGVLILFASLNPSALHRMAFISSAFTGLEHIVMYGLVEYIVWLPISVLWLYLGRLVNGTTLQLYNILPLTAGLGVMLEAVLPVMIAYTEFSWPEPDTNKLTSLQFNMDLTNNQSQNCCTFLLSHDRNCIREIPYPMLQLYRNESGYENEREVLMRPLKSPTFYLTLILVFLVIRTTYKTKALLSAIVLGTTVLLTAVLYPVVLLVWEGGSNGVGYFAQNRKTLDMYILELWNILVAESDTQVGGGWLMCLRLGARLNREMQMSCGATPGLILKILTLKYIILIASITTINSIYGVIAARYNIPPNCIAPRAESDLTTTGLPELARLARLDSKLPILYLYYIFLLGHNIIYLGIQLAVMIDGWYFCAGGGRELSNKKSKKMLRNFLEFFLLVSVVYLNTIIHHHSGVGVWLCCLKKWVYMLEGCLIITLIWLSDYGLRSLGATPERLSKETTVPNIPDLLHFLSAAQPFIAIFGLWGYIFKLVEVGCFIVEGESYEDYQPSSETTNICLITFLTVNLTIPLLILLYFAIIKKDAGGAFRARDGWSPLRGRRSHFEHQTLSDDTHSSSHICLLKTSHILDHHHQLETRDDTDDADSDTDDPDSNQTITTPSSPKYRTVHRLTK